MLQRQYRNKLDYKTQYFYRAFNRANKEKNISEPTYTKILTTFFQLAVRKIIYDGFRLKLPNFGSFYLIKVKQKIIKDKNGNMRLYGSINWPETNKLIQKTGDKSKRVYYLNDHTNRFIYSITWDKYMVDFTNKTFYTFMIHKKHKQALKEAIVTVDKPLNAFEPWYH